MTNNRPDWVHCISAARQTPPTRYSMEWDIFDSFDDENGEWVKWDDLINSQKYKQDEKKSFCGRDIGPTEWYFVDIGHAMNSALDEDRMMLCAECAERASVLLLGHRWVKGGRVGPDRSEG